MLDMLLDPVTFDYVRTANGEWAQTNDSRTIMLIAMVTHLGKSPYDPDHGTAIAELMRDGELVTPEVLQSETMRAGQALANESILSDLVVTVRDQDGNVLRDERGTVVVHASWQDLVSGTPISATFVP